MKIIIPLFAVLLFSSCHLFKGNGHYCPAYGQSMELHQSDSLNVLDTDNEFPSILDL